MRAFHASRRLARDNNPPADPDSKPATNEHGEHNKNGGVAARAEAGDAAEDADMLAQKLQRSREMTRRYTSALRRSQRRNRTQDLPPVVVPAWFVNECVRLSDEVPTSEPLRQFVLQLQRRGTDESGTCTIPIHAPGAALHLLSDYLAQAWCGTLHRDEERRFVRQWALSLGLPDTDEVLRNLAIGGDGVVSHADRTYWLRKEHLLQDPVKIKRKLEIDNAEISNASRHLNLARQAGRLSDEDMRKVERVNERLEGSNAELHGLFRSRHARYVPSFVKAEVHATIAASLSASQSPSNTAFPAAKTNLILHCPSNKRDQDLALLLADIARAQDADVVTLQAQDLAEIAGDYLGDLPDPSPHSIRSLAYETYRLSSDLENDFFFEDQGKDEVADEQDDATSSPASFPSMFPKPPAATGFKMPISIVLPDALSNALKALQTPDQDSSSIADTQARSQSSAETQLEDLKIANVLEHLIDASETKRSQISPRKTSPSTTPPANTTEKSSRAPRGGFFSSLMSSASAPPRDDTEIDIDAALPTKVITQFNLSVKIGPATATTISRSPGSARIIHVPDFKELNATHYGGRILQKLEEIVRKRRLAGERIMIVGSTSSAELTPEFSKQGVQSLQSEGEAGYYRTIVVPVENMGNPHDMSGPPLATLHTRDAEKCQRINVRHIFDMLRRLDPAAAQHLSARETNDSIRTGPALANFSGHFLGRVLTYDEVHRIALIALGLHTLDSTSKQLTGSHVALAIGMLQTSDQVKFDYIRREALRPSPGEEYLRIERKIRDKAQDRSKGTAPTSDRDRELQRKLEKVSMSATKHEKRLMPGIANPAQIKTTFDQIHVPTDTVDSIRTLTSLSLLRPDAFNYGVLATEKISGALLYGPPGTGKTLLAKAVAKESGSTVLEVSGSQIMDKYVGEGEKNVTAIFSLARKLSPCIVFLDEADAIFSSRDVGRERTSHRDILNQFLKEWDGLNDLSVFVMVATNRPFDLDDAVIRRLPRRLLVDLPTEKDRAAILKIHLRGEQLDDLVDLADIAKRTPFYSGSDLKNLAVSAALACVKEENEQAAIAAAKSAASSASHGTESPSSSPDPSKSPQLIRGMDYKFPAKRTLSKRHFDAALQEISASISENMSSLNAIKKFDEKYGDKKGKKAKHVFGIGVDRGMNEDVVRVRP